MITDESLLERAARAAYSAKYGSSPSPKNEQDAVAVAVVYALCGDKDLAEDICDRITEKYVSENMSVENLPSPSFQIHGTYRYVFPEQKWYMFVSGSCSHGGFWNEQSPYDGNRSYFRTQACRHVDSTLHDMRA